MKIILTDDEVREALREAVSSKISNIFPDVDEDSCWFEARDSSNKEVELGEVTFCCDYGDIK